MWANLLPLACSNLRPPSRDEVAQALLDQFAAQTATSIDLSGLCTEQGNTEDELRANARRCVDDAVTCHQLVEATGNSGGYVLSTEETVANFLFTCLRKADELDRLFLGLYAATWEELLFSSPYGRAYVTNSVLPVVSRSYSLPLAARPETDPARTLLEYCPSAARLVLQFRPPPSNLVKESLLNVAALAGALYDLHADPNRLLNIRVREAVRAIAGSDERMASTIRLLEEIALLGGFTDEQVRESFEFSDAGRRVLDALIPDGPGYEINVTQTVPSDAPASTTHLPRLLLASQRAATPIQLANAPDHVLTVRVTADQGLPTPSSDPVMLEVGPGPAQPFGLARLPPHIQVNRQTQTIRLSLGRFDIDSCPAPYPVIVRLPTPPPPGERPTVQFAASIHWPALTVRDLCELEEASQLLQTGTGRLELLIEDSGALLASMDGSNGGELFRLGRWTADVIRGLCDLDTSLPVPLFVPVGRIAELERGTASERHAGWQAIRTEAESDRAVISSLYLRIAAATRVPVEESFLRFFPGTFPPPTIKSGGAISQEEMNQLWENGTEDIQITSFFDTDIFELAQLLRDWCRDPREPFPFTLGPGVPSPLTRSALAIRFQRAVNRIWHFDRPVVFELRPVSRQEAYAMEAEYWRSVGDTRRAELAEEIRTRLDRAAGIRPSESAASAATAAANSLMDSVCGPSAE
jgi:hypothetical protein